jgi:hypothetical protein
MKAIRKWLIFTLGLGLIITTLSGCRSHKKKVVYQQYVQDLMDVNYKGIYDGYEKNEGGSESDAVTMHEDCVSTLANQLISHYSLDNATTVNINNAFIEVARTIYSHADYSVSESYKKDGNYYVDVTIYPIDILNQAYDDIMSHIDSFNTAVAAGKYNSYTEEQYEETFGLGISNILLRTCENIEYQDAVVVTVQIIDDGDYYCISAEDLTAINNAIIALEDQGIASAGDATQE